jgi:lipoteichoic acid synthase
MWPHPVWSCISPPDRPELFLIRITPHTISHYCLNAVKTPNAPAIAVFILFVFANAVKWALFNRILIDVPVFAPAEVFFAGFTGKIVSAFILYICLLWFRQWYWFAGFYCLQTVYLAVNMSYHLSLMGYLHVSQYFGLWSEGFDLVKHSALPHDARLWYVVADVPLFICMLVWYGKFSSMNRRFFIKPSLVAAAAAIVLLVIQWDPVKFSPVQAMKDPYSSDLSVVREHGLFVFNIADLFNYSDTRRHIRSLSYGPEVSSAETTVVHPNILAIQIESLDAFIIDTKYKNRFITPFLHDLSRKSVYYPFVLSYHEAGSTSDCEFSTINSVEPFDDLPSMKLRNYEYPNSMARRFAGKGYTVEAFHGNRGTYFNRAAAFKKMGFGRFHDMFSMGLREVGWGVPDRAVFDFVKTRLLSQREPFFYYIITMTSHEPFTLARPYYQNNFFHTIRNESTRDYFNVMSYVDREIQEIVRSVQNSHPNTYLFIFGDHTPIIQKDVYQRASFIADGRVFEFVPLFIVTPDSRVSRETASAGSFTDIAPTMLAASGIPYTLRSNGADLLKDPLPNSIIPYRGMAYSRSELFKKISHDR